MSATAAENTIAAAATETAAPKMTEQDLGALLEKVIAKTSASRQVVHDTGPFANYLDTAKFEHVWRIGQMFAQSSLVPEHFRGKPSDCAIAVQMALRLGVDPLMFLQNCYLVHGRPGIEAKLAIALANSSGVFAGPIQYRTEGEGKSRSWTAYATMAKTGKEISFTVPWSMVEAEGWNQPRGASKMPSKWATMAEVMGCYRSAMFLLRTHCPEIIMGIQSREELEDTPPPVKTVDELPVGKMSLSNRTTPNGNGAPAPEQEPEPVTKPDGEIVSQSDADERNLAAAATSGSAGSGRLNF